MPVLWYISNMQPNVLHICNKLLYIAFKYSLTYCMLSRVLAWPACDWVFTEHQCIVCAKWTLSRTEDRLVCIKWILSATPGQSPGTDVHGFHISPCLSSWYLFIYVYVSVYCVSPSSGAHTPACQKKKQENEIKCMYPACFPSFSLH